VVGRITENSRLKGSAGDEVPNSWNWQPLDQLILHLRNGIFVSRPVADQVGPAILRISAVRPLRLDTEDVRYIPQAEKIKDARNFVLADEDLLFTRYSGNPEYVGACAMVPPGGPELLYPDKLIRVQADRSLMNPGFMMIAATAGRTRREIRSRVKTTAGQTGISGRDLRSVIFPVPPLDEQVAIVEHVEHHLSRIGALDAQLKSAERMLLSLRSSILAAAFSGKLVKADSGDEPASELLQRISAELIATGGRGRPARTRKTRAVREKAGA
jgi:type I restriction enzyme S subunit